MPTRNVTLSLPDDLVRQARVFAAERDTSVSALVSAALRQLVGGGPDYAEAWAAEEAAMTSSPLRIGTRTSRDALHER